MVLIYDSEQSTKMIQLKVIILNKTVSKWVKPVGYLYLLFILRE